MIDPENLKKMSKDEIIECCSNIADWGFNDYDEWEQQSAVYGLLDLYKKQRKEIEEYKSVLDCIEELKRLKRPVMELVHEMNKFEDEFVSKDKIREKIKELEKEAFKSIAISEKINVLKDLLEEN